MTLRLVDGLPSLRQRATYRVLLAALGAGSERFGMRLVHWSALGNHLHLIVEASDRHALARALNRWWRRSGRVLADRYHVHVLRSPREVRNTLAYVLENARHHRIPVVGADPCSSAPWFDGWIGGASGERADVERPAWLRTARSWLLAHGWRRSGSLELGGP